MIKHNEKCNHSSELHYWEIINIEDNTAEIKCYFCNEKREVEIKVNNDLSKLNQNQLLDIYDFQMSIITYEFKQESEEKLKKEINYLREIKDFLRKLRVHE